MDTVEFASFIRGNIGAIDRVILLLPLSTEQTEIMSIIERGKRLCWLAKDPDDRWSCLRTLGETITSFAYRLQSKGHSQTASAVGRQAVHVTKAALDAHRPGDGSPQHQSTLQNRWKAFHTLSISLLAAGDREVWVYALDVLDQTNDIEFHRSCRANARQQPT